MSSLAARQRIASFLALNHRQNVHPRRLESLALYRKAIQMANSLPHPPLKEKVVKNIRQLFRFYSQQHALKPLSEEKVDELLKWGHFDVTVLTRLQYFQDPSLMDSLLVGFGKSLNANQNAMENDE